MELKVNKEKQPVSTILQEIDRLRQTGVDVANVWIITNGSGIKALQSIGGVWQSFFAPRIDFALKIEEKMIGFKEHKTKRGVAYEVAWIVNNGKEDQNKGLCQCAVYVSRLLEDKNGEEFLFLEIE